MRSTRAILSTLAQVLFLFIAVPVFALICAAFNPTSAVTGIIGFLGQVPLCGTIADILSQYVSGFSESDLASITLWTFFKEFPSAIIAGICVHCCVSLFNHSWRSVPPSARPLPILAGFLGIVLFTLFSNLLDLLGNDFAIFLIELVIVVGMLIGMRFLFSAIGGRQAFSVRRLLLWIIEGLYAVILAVYVAGMMLIMQNRSPISTYAFIVMLAGAAVASSILVFFVRQGVEADER